MINLITTFRNDKMDELLKRKYDLGADITSTSKRNINNDNPNKENKIKKPVDNITLIV